MNTELSPMSAIDEADRGKPALINLGFYGVLVSVGVIALSGLLIHSELQYTIARDSDTITAATIGLALGGLGVSLSMLSILAGCIVSAIREAST